MVYGTLEDRPNSLENLSKNLFRFVHELTKYFNAETWVELQKKEVRNIFLLFRQYSDVPEYQFLSL